MAKNKNDQFGLGRRELLKGAAAVAGVAGSGISVRPARRWPKRPQRLWLLRARPHRRAWISKTTIALGLLISSARFMNICSDTKRFQPQCSGGYA